MTKVWFRAAGRAAGLASAATWAVAAGCSSSSPANGPEPVVDASIDSSSTSLDSGPSAPDAEAAEASVPSRTLLWNVVTAIVPADGGAGADGGEAGAVAASDAGDASVDGGAAASTVPVSGARVCVYQDASIPCVMTAADGTFTLSGLPLVLTDLVITVMKDGYRPTLRAVETASTNMDGTANPITLLSATVADPPVPITIDWQNKGQLTFFAIAPLPDAGATYGGDFGATVALTPAPDSGPYFLHDDGTYDLAATSFVDVPGTYFNLEPGNYELTFTDTIHDCAPIETPFGEWGYPAPPTSVKFPIVAGYVTGPVGIFCTAK